MNNKYIISADSHVFEPADLWVNNLEERFKDRAPRIIENYKDQPGSYFVAEGIKPYRISKIAALAVKPEDLPKFDNASVKDLRTGGWDPVARLKDQEKDGVYAEVIYATYAMYLFGLEDKELQAACFKVYNDWISEYCSYCPDRLIGLALISIHDVDNAVNELKRCSDLGLRGAMITSAPSNGKELSDPEYDLFWKTAEDLDFPISLHILTGSRRDPRRFDSSVFGAGFYMSIPHEIQLTISDIIVRGVLEKHPKLKVVLAEADIGWIPHFLERIDKAYERYSHLNNLFLKKKPSDYFKDQVFSTFISDHTGIHNREFIGCKNILWSSDYPHTDSTWPNSLNVINENLKNVSDIEFDSFTSMNTANLYNIELPKE